MRRPDPRDGGVSRKQFLSTGLIPLARPQARISGRPKNVLLIMSDQHRPRGLGVAGERLANTPNLDTLARTSVRFESAYCANPVCLPSRASMLTGLFTHHHGALNNGTPWPFAIRTAAHYFGRAGYMSALCGKMHFADAQTHGFDYIVEFNEWFQYLGPKTRIYADELGQPNGGAGLPQIPDLWRESGDPWKDVRQHDGRKALNHPGRASRMPEQDHFESFVTREAVRFLKNHGSRQPFFLIASYLKPHSPFMPAERFAKMFSPEDMVLPETWGKVDLSNVPREIRERIAYDHITPELAEPRWAKVRIASYWASVAQLDDNIGRLLNALRELNLEKDTAVIFTSDHGDMLGEHGLWDKYVFYEDSVGVPLLVRVPGLTPEGRVSKTPVGHVQLLPTLIELCDIAGRAGPLPSFDGESFVRDLREPGATRRTAVFSEFNLRTPKARYMMRSGDRKYCHYVGDEPELYDLREDPREMNNLARLPEYRSRVEEMRARLFEWFRPTEKGAA